MPFSFSLLVQLRKQLSAYDAVRPKVSGLELYSFEFSIVDPLPSSSFRVSTTSGLQLDSFTYNGKGYVHRNSPSQPQVKRAGCQSH